MGVTDVVDATLVLPLAKQAWPLVKAAAEGQDAMDGVGMDDGLGDEQSRAVSLGRVWAVKTHRPWNQAHGQWMWLHEQGCMWAWRCCMCRCSHWKCGLCSATGEVGLLLLLEEQVLPLGMWACWSCCKSSHYDGGFTGGVDVEFVSVEKD